MLRFKKRLIAVLIFCVAFLMGNLGTSYAQSENNGTGKDESELEELHQSKDEQKEPGTKKAKKKSKKKKVKKKSRKSKDSRKESSKKEKE